MIHHEIVATADPLWPAWRALYLDAFPPEERMTERYLVEVLEQNERGEESDEHMMASWREPGSSLEAIWYYQLVAELKLGFLWYLAVTPHVRGAGIGTACYRQLCELLDEAGADLLVFEVEKPDLARDGEYAQRRIGWYFSLGAFRLDGVHYLQETDSGHGKVPMFLMIHPLRPTTADKAFERARELFGENIEQIGPLSLESAL